ncbi:MAG: PD-(D/E)XK nuclease family protein, partial [Planctomycetota bacterium]|nr:PD-(D/E)XK nuclease family protein [Planctomycetota bacterium]
VSTVSGACYEKSLETDRWATASELMLRRDQLMLEGWDGKRNSDFPRLVQDLAEVELASEIESPNVATRLHSILAALAAGQELSSHVVHLGEDVALWPGVWREVFQRLNVKVDGEPVPDGFAGSALASAQGQCVSGLTTPISPDDSLRWVKSTSTMTACEFIASVVKKNPDLAYEMVVCCEDDAQALCLDGCLSRAGMPTMGTVLHSRSHPVLQILPLALSLSWEPVDPYLLLDFLTLPVSPIRKKVSSALSEAMREQPGYGSAAWDEAVAKLLKPGDDESQKIKERLDKWLDHPKTELGQKIAPQLIAERCRLVANWASAYASRLEQNEEEPELARSLRIAARQSTNLEEMMDAQVGDISEAQLIRLRDAALADSGVIEPYVPEEGGPRRIRNLSEMMHPCSFLVWLGTGTEQRLLNRWTTAELRALQKAGLDIDDGHREVVALRHAERRGFNRVQTGMLAIELQGDVEKRPHPLWLQVEAALTANPANVHAPILLDDVLKNKTYSDIFPWEAKSKSFRIKREQPTRDVWTVDPALLAERDSSSYSSLESRLACPLKWVFNYQARLSPGPIAQLPSSFLLKGNFCHSVLETVFGGGGKLPSESAAAKQVEKVFEERLPLDAAPLAQPHCMDEREAVKQQLLNATKVLIGALKKGGYEVRGCELKPEGKIDSRKLGGSIDCLVESDVAGEAIIDFKYSGYKKYRDLLTEGRAVQLATYSECRRQETGNIPAVAYLILIEGYLYTPKGSSLAGAGKAEVLTGPGIDGVWQDFLDALHNAEGWLASGEIPVRPHQFTCDWPDGVDMVLKEKLKNNEQQEVCKYCNYKKLCGLEMME